MWKNFEIGRPNFEDICINHPATLPLPKCRINISAQCEIPVSVYLSLDYKFARAFLTTFFRPCTEQAARVLKPDSDGYVYVYVKCDVPRHMAPEGLGRLISVRPCRNALVTSPLRMTSSGRTSPFLYGYVYRPYIQALWRNTLQPRICDDRV